MQAADWIRLIEIIGQILGPIALEMAHAFERGEDPFAVLARERVEAIVPSPLRSELALLQAKARGGADATVRTSKAP